jgi:hypothetical protein
MGAEKKEKKKGRGSVSKKGTKIDCLKNTNQGIVRVLISHLLLSIFVVRSVHK